MVSKFEACDSTLVEDKEIEIILVVVGAIGTVMEKVLNGWVKLGLIRTEMLQKTARIL